MKPLQKLTVYSKIMLGICLALSVVIVAEAMILNIDAGSDAVAPGAQSRATMPDGAADVRPLLIPPIITFRHIAERPLFSDTRRPQAARAADNDSAAAGQLGATWKLKGIVVAGDRSSVHVHGVRDSRTERLQVGMSLDGWRLDSITRDRADFSSGGRTATLWLHEEQQEEEAPKVAPIKRR
jgi:hypothetical protein